MHGPDDERIEDLVAEFVEQRDAGAETSPEEFAAAHADCAPALLDRLHALLRVEGLFPGAAPPAGSRIGGWQILRELGRGGMGRVYAVRKTGDDTVFALKLLSPLLAVDERATERFRREAEALRRFDHPGAARIHEFGHHDGAPFLVMERIDGEPLAAIIEAARQTGSDQAPAERLALRGQGTGETRAAALCSALCRTIAAAHSIGLVHRDLKPSNVILRADGSPVIIDFGLARQSGTPTLTGTGDLLGTPHYMAPELARGLRPDHRVDIYALGAILYELVTSGHPYEADEPTAVLMMMQRTPPVPARRREPRVSRAMDTIVRRALATRREHRFQDAGAFAAALDDLVAGRSTTRVPLAQRLHEGWRWHGRKLAATLGVALLAISTLLFASHRSARTEQRLAELLPEAIAARFERDQATVQSRGAALAAIAERPLHRYFATWNADAPVATADADPAVMALLAGDAAMARGDFAPAGVDYRRAGAEGAPASLVAGLLGLSALAAGDPDGAARELTVAVRQLPDVAILQQRLGEALAAQEQWIESAEALGRAAELRDHDHALWHQYALAADRAGRGHVALVATQHAIEVAGPAEIDTYKRTQAAILNGLGDKDASIAAFRDLVERMPRRAGLLYNLGFTYDGGHRFAEARDCYERAIAIDPDHRESLGCLAWMLAGAKPDCVQCQDWFRTHPGFADLPRAMDLALRALRIDRGQRRESLGMAVEIARRADRGGDLKAAVQELLALPDQDDLTVGRLTKLLKKL